MNILNVDTHNILLNGQPYPLGSIRLIYPTLGDDNWVSFIYPWWGTAGNVLWRGDVTQMINGQTGLPFTSLANFEAFCNANIYWIPNIRGTISAPHIPIATAPNTIGDSPLQIISSQLYYPGSVKFQGPCSFGHNVVTLASGGNIISSYYLVQVNTTGGAASLTIQTTGAGSFLPGQPVVIKKSQGANAITITPTGGGTIDGAASFTFGSGAAFPSITLIFDGATNFVII